MVLQTARARLWRRPRRAQSVARGGSCGSRCLPEQPHHMDCAPRARPAWAAAGSVGGASARDGCMHALVLQRARGRLGVSTWCAHAHGTVTMQRAGVTRASGCRMSSKARRPEHMYARPASWTNWIPIHSLPEAHLRHRSSLATRARANPKSRWERILGDRDEIHLPKCTVCIRSCKESLPGTALGMPSRLAGQICDRGRGV